MKRIRGDKLVLLRDNGFTKEQIAELYECGFDRVETLLKNYGLQEKRKEHNGRGEEAKEKRGASMRKPYSLSPEALVSIERYDIRRRRVGESLLKRNKWCIVLTSKRRYDGVQVISNDDKPRGFIW